MISFRRPGYWRRYLPFMRPAGSHPMSDGSPETRSPQRRRAGCPDSTHPSALVLDRLIQRRILQCSICSSQFAKSDAGALLCDGGHSFALEFGVLNLYDPSGQTGQLQVKTSRKAAIVGELAERFALDAADISAAGLLDPLPETGNDFFDAEEEIFVDRFALINVHPRLVIERIYATGRMQAGATSWLAVRVKNAGDFTISSSGERPVLLTYRLYDVHGELLVEEGRRSALPIDLEPGRSVTAHIAIDAIATPGRFRLELSPVHEHVAWLFEGSRNLDLEIFASPEPEPPATSDPHSSFSEARDDELAFAFLDEHLSSRITPLLGLEIGGGISAALSRWHWERAREGSVINADISVRLLRLAALLSRKGSDPVTLHARFDANSMPIASASLDAVVFSRSLHHFADPVRVLSECRRVLKPEGLLFLLCEPVASEYDEATRKLIRRGVNEQVFPLDAYTAMTRDAGFEASRLQVDWGFSLKGSYRIARQP